LVVVAAGLLVVVEGTKPSPESAEPVLVMEMQVPDPCPVRPQCQAQPLLSPAAQSKSASRVEGKVERMERRRRTEKVFIFLTSGTSSFCL